MEANELTIKLEQRDWERLQKLSERNGEPMERLAARFLAGNLAKVFNKPPEIPWNSKTRQVYESFVEGRTQSKPSDDKIPTPTEAANTRAIQDLQLTNKH